MDKEDQDYGSMLPKDVPVEDDGLGSILFRHCIKDLEEFG